MPDDMNEQEERAYREGVLATRLDNHDAHFQRLNGSMEKTVDALAELNTNVSGLNDTVTGMALVMPKLQSVADDVTRAEQVAETLRLKTLADRTRWERWRLRVAWAVGLVVAAVTATNFVLRLSGH